MFKFHLIKEANAELIRLAETIAQLEATCLLPAGSTPSKKTIGNAKAANLEIERRRALVSSALGVAPASTAGERGTTAQAAPLRKTSETSTAADAALWKTYFGLGTASERAAFYEANATALSQANERLEEARKSQTQTSWSRNFLGSQHDPETIAERDRLREESRDPAAKAWSRPFIKR